MQNIGLRMLMKRLRAIGFMMKDKNVKLWKKLLVIVCAAYIICPIDLVPIAIFPVAWMDDLFVFFVMIYILKDTLDTYWLGEKDNDLSQNFDSDDIVEGVEYEVTEEENFGKVIHLRREDPGEAREADGEQTPEEASENTPENGDEKGQEPDGE